MLCCAGIGIPRVIMHVPFGSRDKTMRETLTSLSHWQTLQNAACAAQK